MTKLTKTSNKSSNRPIENFKNAPTTNSGYAIKPNDRVFITGKTGSGKSTVAQYLLFPTPRLIVIDGKDGIKNSKWNLEDYAKGDLRRIKDHETYRIRLVNNYENIIEVLNMVYDSNNEETPSTIIYIDEVTATIEPKSKTPQIFTDIWTRGRSRKIGAWSNTQRPTSIPLIFLSEAEHIFMFALNLEDDRKRVAQIVGKDVMTKPKDIHGFYYYNMYTDSLRYYQRLNI